MQVIANELIAFFDVDDTLVEWIDSEVPGPEKLTCWLYHKHVYVTPHLKHIELLKSFKERGYTICVWSGNGWSWTQEIIKNLRLEGYVDFCLSKPIKIVDNEPYTNWLPTPIYLVNK